MAERLSGGLAAFTPTLGEGGREGFYSVAALAEQVMQRVSDFQYFSLGEGGGS